MLEQAGRVGGGKTAIDLFGEDGNRKAGMRDLLTILGVASGFPLAPLAKPGGYLLDYQSGKAARQAQCQC